MKAPGEYRVTFGEVESPEFAIGADAYQDVPGEAARVHAAAAVRRQPGDGREVPSAGRASTPITGETVDLVGGWHDAGDRLKHMITTSYCVAALFLAEPRKRRGMAPR